MLKKILNILMIIMMVGTLVPLQANMNKVKAATDGNWIDVADTSWYGDGSATTFNISSAEQLAGLAQLVNGRVVDGVFAVLPVDFSGKTIVLSADIDLAGKKWTPIGDGLEGDILDSDGGYLDTIRNTFKGTFTGDYGGDDYASLSNLSMNSSGSYFGLFGRVSSSSISKLNLENIQIYSTGYSVYVGGLVGRFEKGMIESVDVSGNINITNIDASRMGGMVGSLYEGTIQWSSVVAQPGSIISGNQEIGGLVGEVGSDSIINGVHSNINVESVSGQVGGLIGYAYNANVSKSYSIGSVYGETYNVGGFIGELSDGVVEDSYSTGSVTLGADHANFSSVGGFVGLNGGRISNAYSAGKVEGTAFHADDKIGGFVGSDNWRNGIVTNAYWDITTSGQDTIHGLETNAQGTGLSKSDMKKQATFDAVGGFDFSTTPVWLILSGTTISYPFLNENHQSPEPGKEVVNPEEDAAPLTWIDEKDLTWSGSGSVNDPYIISSAEELAGLAYAVNVEGKYSTDNYSPTFFQLFASSTPINQRLIDLDGREWTPIGTIEHPFIAFFNGNLTTINHLTINAADSDNVGLFGVTGVSTVAFTDRQNSVENLYLTNVDVKGRNYVGALVGHGSYINVRNVKADGSVKGKENVGGLVGRTDAHRDPEEFFNTVRVSGFSGTVEGESKVGGLIGSSFKTTPRYDYAEVQITVPNNAYDIGGLVGRAENGRIWQTYTRGSIQGGSGLSNIGQLVGYNNKEIKYNLSSLDLNLGSNLSNASGLIGFTEMHSASIQYYVVDNYSKNLIELKASAEQYDKLNFMITDDLTKIGAIYDSYRASYNWFIKTNLDTPRLWFEIRQVSYPTPSWKGLGTESQPYLINTVEQLRDLASFTNSGDSFEDKYFALDSDLDLSSITNWIPIGNTITPFKGIFDGNKKTITGLNIQIQNGVYINDAGLFGVTGPTAEIYDLTLKDIDVKGRINVGGLVGLAQGGDFSNISVEGKVYGDSLNIGGIIGKFFDETPESNASGKLLKSHFIGTIDTNGEVSNIGGLIGYNVYAVDMSYAEVTLRPGESSTDIGGLVGYNKAGDIKFSYAIGDMISQDHTSNVGGLVGHHENTFSSGGIDSVYALMNFISEDRDSNFGFLVGTNAPTDNGLNLGKINRSFASGNINGISGITIGGLIGLNNDSDNPSLSEMVSLTDLKKLSTFANKKWSILLMKNHDGTDPKNNLTGTTAIWYLDEGTDTPRLWYQRVLKDSDNSSNNTSNNTSGSSNTSSSNNTNTSSSLPSNTPTQIINKPIVKPIEDIQGLVVEYSSQQLKDKIKLPELGNIKSLKVDLVYRENKLENTVKYKVVNQLKLEGKQLLLELQAQVTLSIISQDDQNSVQDLSNDALFAPITLNLPIPNDVKAEDIRVIRILDDGSYEFVQAKIVTIDNMKYYSFETMDLSNYGLVTPLAAPNEDVRAASGLGLIWYFVYGGILLGAAWFFWFILFKRRKKEEKEE